jgi:hypothetical protein
MSFRIRIAEVRNVNISSKAHGVVVRTVFNGITYGGWNAQRSQSRNRDARTTGLRASPPMECVPSTISK